MHSRAFELPLFIERERRRVFLSFDCSRKVTPGSRSLLSHFSSPLSEQKEAPALNLLLPLLLSAFSFYLSLLFPHTSMGERPVRLPQELEDVPPRPLEVREKSRRELTRKSPFSFFFLFLRLRKKKKSITCSGRRATPFALSLSPLPVPSVENVALSTARLGELMRMPRRKRLNGAPFVARFPRRRRCLQSSSSPFFLLLPLVRSLSLPSPSSQQ